LTAWVSCVHSRATYAPSTVRRFSYGTCAAACLVRTVKPEFNPRRIEETVMLDMREVPLLLSTVTEEELGMLGTDIR